MSKITPKNLSYDDSLPPFLQRLRANNASLDGRNEFQSARPKKLRSKEDDAEDEPVYFDEESGETLTKKEWEEKDKPKDDGGEGVEDDGESKVIEKREGEKEKTAVIGVNKKRKAGKVVGGDDGDGEKEKADTVRELKKAGKIEKTGRKNVEKGKGMKTGKKIKLSFGDDE